MRIKANPARWQRLKVILADALEQTSFEERTAMLRRSCADDKTLLREAEKLLAHDTTAFEEFAEFAATRLRHDERDRIGERIGAYAIVRELGRGGMGAVYLAKRADGEFEKRVAIKVLKRGTDTDEVLRRFRTERQILANLEHPNITRLLDAGSTTDGLPYFVMEFIEGTPITRFVECENVNLRDRLKLFLKVCSAVGLAHRHHIIHRDIKPGNVLVNDDGDPKLLDFGIAKLLGVDFDDGDTTIVAERRLTPMYAAPEQRAGQPATMATDVYSLGALLYELLANEPPHSGSSGDLSQRGSAAADGIVGHAPRLPDHKLDQIVVRAMQHDPAQRYSSATGLCQDVERYLNRAGPGAKLYSATATGSRRRWYIAAMTFAGIGLAAALLLPLRRNVSKPGTVNTATSPASETSTNAATIPSIAVLPFESLSEDKSNAYFADGIQDAILARLSKIGDLKVISRTSTQKYKSAPDNLREIAQQLGVANILEGSVQKAGDQVRITVRLINAIKDDHLWADTYDRKMTDIFGVETDVAQKIASSLEAKLTGREKREIAFVGTKNPEAYDAVLHALALRGSQRFEDAGKRREFFQRAVELDPSYAQAWAFLGGEDAQLYFFPDSTAARKEKARTEVETALRLAPDLVEAHNYVGLYKYYCLQDYDGAIAELNIARERSPNDWSALFITSLVKRRQGKFDDSIRVMQQAAVLDPLNEDIAVNLGRTYRGLRQFDEARAMFDRALAIVPNDPQVQCSKAETYLAQGDAEKAWQMVKDVKISPLNWGFGTYMTLLAVRRQFDEMIDSFSSAATRNDLPSLLRVGSLAALANTYMIKGDRAGALPFRAQAEKNRRALQNPERFSPMMYAPFIEMEARFGDRDAVKRDVKNLFEQTEKDKWEFPNSEVSAAVGYMLLGDFDRALPFLQDALSHPSETSITPSNLRLSPIWDPIRSDPRFEKLIGKQ